MKRAFAILFLILLMVNTGCVGRKKPDDIKLIKNLLDRVSYTLNQKDYVLLDSLYYGEKTLRDSLISELKNDLKSLGEIKSLGFGGKRIEIYEKQAFVDFTLVGEKEEKGQIKKFEIPMELSLLKKGERWKVIGHSVSKPES
jgi:hypothetical protein